MFKQVTAVQSRFHRKKMVIFHSCVKLQEGISKSSQIKVGGKDKRLSWACLGRTKPRFLIATGWTGEGDTIRRCGCLDPGDPLNHSNIMVIYRGFIWDLYGI